MVICKFNLKLYGDSCKFKGPYDKTLDLAATPFEVESGLFHFKIPQSLSHFPTESSQRSKLSYIMGWNRFRVGFLFWLLFTLNIPTT